ncbi:MAG TPA: methyltransferase, partial [Mucilaginibacter sp.]|nr:methyltransferase [Mucilaginibacter sp.]
MSDYKDYGFTTGAPAHTFGYLLEPLQGMLDKSRNKLILDLGCGNGFLANYLVKLGYNVYGSDAS